jgi:hypothetical protein
MKKDESIEQYEYAKQRVKQKKNAFFPLCSFCFRKFVDVLR